MTIAGGKTPVMRLVPYLPEQPERGFGSIKEEWLNGGLRQTTG